MNRLACLLAGATLLFFATGVRANTIVGDIEVCYFCNQNLGAGTFLDGPTFIIHNTSGTAITNAVLTIGPGGGVTDSFNVGTIGAGSLVAVIPGISNDGGLGHTFFQIGRAHV
jgi:hypothetical protein